MAEKFTSGPASTEPTEKPIPLVGTIEGVDAILNTLVQTVEAGHSVAFRLRVDDIYVGSHMLPVSHLEEFLTAHRGQRLVLLEARDMGLAADSAGESLRQRRVYVIIRRKRPDGTKEVHSVTDVTSMTPTEGARVYDMATKIAEELGAPGEYGMRVHYSDKLPQYMQDYLATKEKKS